MTAPVQPPVGPGGGPGPAVAARVHRGREQQRALEGVLEHRQRDRRHRPDAAGRVPAQLPGPAHPLHALGELGRDRHRDDDGRPDLVQRGGQRPEQALGVGQGVGGADAGDDHREPQPEHGRADQALEVDRAAELDAGRPRRQGHLGQGEQDDLAELEPDDHVQDDAHHDDGEPQPEVEAERAGPRRGAPPVRHDQRDDREGEEEQEWVVRRADRDGHPERPPPPRGRVDRAGEGGAHRTIIASGASLPGRVAGAGSHQQHECDPGEQGAHAAVLGVRGRRGRSEVGRRCARAG